MPNNPSPTIVGTNPYFASGQSSAFQSSVDLIDGKTTLIEDEQSPLVPPTLSTHANLGLDKLWETRQPLRPSKLLTVKRPAPPRPKETSARFVVHEMWEGVVEEVCDSYFVAQLVSKTIPNTYEIAEIYRSEVSSVDIDLLRPGAVFYWAIGYEDRPSGQRSRSSIIRFRRLPPIKSVRSSMWVESAEKTWLTSS